MARTYTLNDLGVTIDDLILLQGTGYEFDESEDITEEKREEVLARIYEAKQTQKSKDTKPITHDVPAATVEQAKQVKYDAKNGKEVSLQDMASVVKAETIINKDLRDQLPNVIKSAVEKDSLTAEEVSALGYLLDELKGKHVEDKKNPHSIHEYNKRFADMPELLEQAAQKVKEASVTVVPAVEKTYTKEEIEELLTAGEVYLMKPSEAFGKEGEKENVADAHNDGFADHVTKMSALIKDYGEGKVDVAPDALLDMDKLVALYGKEYARGTAIKDSMSYDVTQDAANASQRVAFEKKLHGIKTPVEEKIVVVPVEEETKDVDQEEKDRIEYLRKNNRYIRSNVAGKHRTAEQWGVLYEYIDHNPTLKTDEDRRKAKEKLDEDFERTANKEVKEAFAKKNENQTDDVVAPVVVPVEVQEDSKEEEKGNGEDKGRGTTIIPVVIPHDKGDNDKGDNANVVSPSDDKGNNNITDSDDKKEKKGLFGWIGEKAKKVGDWAKRNWKKLAIGGAILAAAMFGPKACEGGEKDDGKKDNIEVVTPTPTPEKATESKDTIDIAMAHQYCKRMGYQDSMSQEDAIAKYFQDRETYSSVKDKYAPHMGIDSLSVDEQMAVLATVRGNTPDNAPVIDAVLNGQNANIVSVKKLEKETAKFVVKQENGTIQYRTPEDFTKQTGTQSIEVSKDKLVQQAELAGFVAQAKGGNTH
ncbi:MAG: hypothetical protein IJZ59_08140 [Alphaproteobacteria bacterium]|nr:hypothetical protein [Alphaproteobacteria bacterium]